MELKRLATLAMFTLGATAAQAGTFDFGGNGTINLGTFDWAPSNFLAQNGQQAITNWLTSGGTCPAGSCSFTILTEAKLIGTLNPSNVVNTPAGLGTKFELTYIASFTETVTFASIALQQANFTASPGGYIQIYYDAPANANDLTGNGFNNGTLILTGTLQNTPSGQFVVTAKDPQQCPNPGDCPLDMHGANDYTGQLTVSGFGSNGNATINVTGQDSAFFITPVASLGLQFQNISIGLPYLSVDPADCYNNANAIAIGATGTSTCDNNHVNGLMSAQGGPGIIPNIGPDNGLFGGGSPDFVAQTDNNSPVQFTTPEPGSLLLIGVGLLGMGLRRRRGSV